MGLRFRKSFKIAPGIRLNFGKKSSSISFGGKGARYTVSTTGKRTTTVGIPGSGLSYSHTSGGRKKAKSKPKANSTEREIDVSKNKQKVKKPVTKRWWFFPLIICLVIGAISSACGDKDADNATEETPIEAVEEITEGENEVIAEEVEEEKELGDPVGEATFVPVTYENEESETEREPETEEAPVATTDKSETTTDTTTNTTTNTTTEEPIEVTVYVTNTGEKYHREGCQYLKKSKIPISLTDAKARYSPCSKCKP